MNLEEKLSSENLKSYVNAAMDLGMEIRNVILEEGCKNILIPSRGAFPFYELAKKSLIFAKETINPEKFRHDPLALFPVYPSECMQAEDSEEDLNNPIIQAGTENHELVMPFSAYTNKWEINTELRKYWVRVYDNLMKQPNDWDIGVKFYQHILEEVAGFMSPHEKLDEMSGLMGGKDTLISGRLGIAEYVPTHLAKRKTIYLDTAIMGFSSVAIMKEMEARNMDFLALLIFDQEGKKINSENIAYIKDLEARKKLKCFYVKSLFTEDQSPAFLGATSVVYPDFVDQASEMPAFKDLGLAQVGAGCWMPIPYKNVKLGDKIHSPMMSGSRIMREMLFDTMCVIHAELGHNYLAKNISYYEDNMEKGKENFLDLVTDYSLQDKQETEKAYAVGLDHKLKPTRIEATGSHIIRAHYNTAVVNKVLKSFEQKYL